MPKSTRGPKPAKPHPDFPLFPHATGRWAKKVRGKLHYFGPWRDPQGALESWLLQKDFLLAGKAPPPPDALEIRDVCNAFLAAKERALKSGELAPRTFERYHSACVAIVEALGGNTAVESLGPADFARYRERLAKRLGPVGLGNEIQMARSVFRYAYAADLLARPVKFGPEFRRPSAKTLRKVRTGNGPRLFTPQQIRDLIDAAGYNLRSMVLLGINGGLGNTDLGLLPTAALDLIGGWLNYPRAKTAINRKIPLWAETIQAVRDTLANRPQPKDPGDNELLFIGPRGRSYAGNHRGYRVTAEFTRTAKAAGVVGRTFYDLRRTFQTIGEGAGDLVAVRSIMGHAPASGDMSAVYRQEVADDRLQAVVGFVHDWLFNEQKTD